MVSDKMIHNWRLLELIQLYKQKPLEKDFNFTIYQNYTLALRPRASLLCMFVCTCMSICLSFCACAFYQDSKKRLKAQGVCLHVYLFVCFLCLHILLKYSEVVYLLGSRNICTAESLSIYLSQIFLFACLSVSYLVLVYLNCSFVLYFSKRNLMLLVWRYISVFTSFYHWLNECLCVFICLSFCLLYPYFCQSFCILLTHQEDAQRNYVHRLTC